MSCLFSARVAVRGQQRESGYLRCEPLDKYQNSCKCRSVFTSENERLDPFPALRNVCFGNDTEH